MQIPNPDPKNNPRSWSGLNKRPLCQCRDFLTSKKSTKFPEDTETDTEPAVVAVRSCPAEWEECGAGLLLEKGSFVSFSPSPVSLTLSYKYPHLFHSWNQTAGVPQQDRHNYKHSFPNYLYRAILRPFCGQLFFLSSTYFTVGSVDCIECLFVETHCAVEFFKCHVWVLWEHQLPTVLWCQMF